MLEETRKGINQETKVVVKEEKIDPMVIKEAREAFDYKLAKMCEDAIYFLKLIGGSQDQIEFYMELKTYAETHGRGIDPVTGKHFYELDQPLINKTCGFPIWERTVYRPRIVYGPDGSLHHGGENVKETSISRFRPGGLGWKRVGREKAYLLYTGDGTRIACIRDDYGKVLKEQFDKYGYEVPDYYQIVRIPLTEKEKEDMLEIKKIAGEYWKRISELEKKAGFFCGSYGLSSDAPEVMHTAIDQLRDASGYYSSYLIEGNTLITASPIKKAGMLDYFDSSNDFAKYMKYWEEKYLDEVAKILSPEDVKNALNIISYKQYGALTKFLVEEDYKKLAEKIRDKNWGEILESEIEIKKTQNGILYKILHFIEALGKKEEKGDIFDDEFMQKVLDFAHQKYRVGQEWYINSEGYESGIPIYIVRRTEKTKGTIYFNNNKKEIIKFPAIHGSYTTHHIDQNTIEIITEDGVPPIISFKTKLYVDCEDILCPYS